MHLNFNAIYALRLNEPLRTCRRHIYQELGRSKTSGKVAWKAQARNCVSQFYNELEDGGVVDTVEVAGDVVLADVEVFEFRGLEGGPLFRVILVENSFDVEAVAEGTLPSLQLVLLDAVKKLELKFLTSFMWRSKSTKRWPIVNVIKLFWRKSKKSRFILEQEYAIFKQLTVFEYNFG